MAAPTTRAARADSQIFIAPPKHERPSQSPAGPRRRAATPSQGGRARMLCRAPQGPARPLTWFDRTGITWSMVWSSGRFVVARSPSTGRLRDISCSQCTAGRVGTQYRQGPNPRPTQGDSSDSSHGPAVLAGSLNALRLGPSVWGPGTVAPPPSRPVSARRGGSFPQREELLQQRREQGPQRRKDG